MDTVLKLFVGAAVLLVWYIMSKDRGEKEPPKALWAAAGFGVLGLIAAIILEVVFLPEDSAGSIKLSGGQLLNTAIGIGVIEEICKFLPLAFFIYKKKYFDEFNDGVLYFTIAGLGFGLPENLMYTLSGGVGVGIMRLIMTPFFHAATTAFVGYFLVKMKIGRGNLGSVVMALLAVIAAHAAYDYGLMREDTWPVLVSLLITVGLNIMLVVLVKTARKHDSVIGKIGQAVLTPQSDIVPRTHNNIEPQGTAKPMASGQQHKTGLATASLVIGIISIPAGTLPFIGFILGIPAVIMGIVAYRYERGIALGGIITGAIGTLFGLIWIVVITLAVVAPH